MARLAEPCLALVIYSLLGLAIYVSGIPALLASAFWIGGGIYMVANSQSRGLIADLSFIATWPLWVALEGR